MKPEPIGLQRDETRREAGLGRSRERQQAATGRQERYLVRLSPHAPSHLEHFATLASGCDGRTRLGVCLCELSVAGRGVTGGDSFVSVRLGGVGDARSPLVAAAGDGFVPGSFWCSRARLGA